jgi:cobalt/nickel transport system permease protein
VGAGHTSALYLDRDSPVHRLPPQVKIVASVAVTVVVVATPRENFAAFGAYALLLMVVAAVTKLSPAWLGRRMLLELPFVVLAVVLPFAGTGARVHWWGLSLSENGLLGAWNIVAKGTLGVVASLILAGSTSPRDLLLGLQRLRMPTVAVQIATFMLRYLEVITDQARRMRIARLSRGHDPRFLWQVKAFAASAGTLFIRSFERGERVYLAMISRGYHGAMPMPSDGRASGGQWVTAMVVPLAALTVALTSWRLR